MLRRILILSGLLLISLLTWIIISRIQKLSPPQQPINFSHRVHDEHKIECLYCHSNALRSSTAGLPSVEKCIGCHEVITPESQDVIELAGYWERQEAIPWVRVNLQPDFVYYSHLPHLQSGLNCEDCHGNVGMMDTARPAKVMNMGWCIDCHNEQPEAKVARLSDCLTCHK